MRGLARAEAAGADAIAVFTAATDAFTHAQHRHDRRRVARGVRAGPGAGRASSAGGGAATSRPRSAARTPAASSPHRAVEVALRLLELGVDEVCFGDTIGVGVPGQVAALTGLAVEAGIPLERIAYHFHDTRGTALANVAAGLDAGVRCFDSSAGGTGGCPYAPGAAGNLATEDLVYFLDASGWETGGVASTASSTAARFIADALGRPLATKVGQAGGWDPAPGAATGRA